MNISSFFIRRPVATTLLSMGIVLAGILGFRLLPVSALPQVDFPTITVSAGMPGASPETMAATIAMPLERALGTIAGITEMTSVSTLSNTRIVLQFDLDRSIDGAARDVQAALNAAQTLLPTGLPNRPTYRKANPADAPIMILALTSQSMTQGQMYDVADTILAQKLSQVPGMGNIIIGGSAQPAVRIALNPDVLAKYAISTSDVRSAVAATNANRPKGLLEEGSRHWQIHANDQASTAAQYLPIIVAFRNKAPVYLRDVAHVHDAVSDIRTAGAYNGKPSVLLTLFRQPGANIIKTVDAVASLLPQLRASIPATIHLEIAQDRTPSIRASLKETEHTLLIAISLVILVVFIFLRHARAAIIATVAVPISLIGTFAMMYLLGFSLNNFSLMALIIATGFVVDDAIVVLENVCRHLEQGMSPKAAALAGTREVGFTVMSMSLSLIAVFIPILFMGGVVGRLFSEFAMTLSVAILISLWVSLTMTSMMCAKILASHQVDTSSSRAGLARFFQMIEAHFNTLLQSYKKTLALALRWPKFMILILSTTIALNIYLYHIVPKGFFPQQDTGRLIGGIQGDQAISFQAMKVKMDAFIKIIKADPNVDNVIAYTGGGRRNSGMLFVTLKPKGIRKINADQVMMRLRPALNSIAGATVFLQSVQDIRIGGRSSHAQYQYTLHSDDLDALREWEPRIRTALSERRELIDVNTDQNDNGTQTRIVLDRDTIARLNTTVYLMDNTLNDLFGQRQISVIYQGMNQYRVIMEAAPQYLESQDILKTTYINTKTSTQIPLSAFSRVESTNTPLAVNHQGQFIASTISFNLPQGVSLSNALQAIDDTFARLGVPSSIHGQFAGAASVFQKSLASQPFLILMALATVYIVLGVLYESFMHPLTILSTLPSAGLGALLALLATKTALDVIGLIGIILLIGIVKKNAIIMIDFARVAQREQGLSAHDAIFQACCLRFRPIMMTTMSALFGALPLAFGTGDGAELRIPLGISIVGGLMVSQLLTLYTTPVVYLSFDKLRRKIVLAVSPLFKLG